MFRIQSVPALVLLAWAAAAGAQDRHDTAAIQRVVEQFVKRETAGLPGQVSFSVGQVDPRVALAPCPVPQAFHAPGGRLWGAVSVGVRCSGPTPWTIYVPATVRVVGNFLVSARPLAQGQVIEPADFAVSNGELTALPAGVLTQPAQAVGKTVVVGLAAGQPLRQDMLRALPVIQQGQSVRLVSQGPGFRVSAEGRALNSAPEGVAVQVRSVSGNVVSGIARQGGVVEITY